MTPVEPAHFSSDYSSYLYGFVESKRRSGYKYNGEVKELQRFDRFLSANGQTPTDNSRDVIYGWLAKRDNESDKTFSTRNSVYRQLYGYLSSESESPMLPVPPEAREKIHGSGFTPYIFTHDEIKHMFSAIDNEVGRDKVFRKCAPLLFRTLYGTGLRINEALSLRVGDVLLDKGFLVILEAKNDDSRLVPMSHSLLMRMQAYIESVDYPNEKPLFQTSTGHTVSDSHAYEWFRWMLWRAGIPHRGRGKGPRLHDLRHTFAVHSLQAAVERGLDPYAFLPILSVYLGHKNLSATERYLRLTSEAYPYLTKEMDKIMDSIIPEVQDYEK